MTIKRITKWAFNSGYIFPYVSLRTDDFTDKEMTLDEWVYKSLGEYLKLCEDVRTCYAKKVETILPAGDETGFKMGYSEFTDTVKEILKDKDEIEVNVKYSNSPDITFIHLDASQLCDCLKENYGKGSTDITVNQSTVLDTLSELEDGEFPYALWFWTAFMKSVHVYHKLMTDADLTIKDKPKITKKEAWERLNSEIIYGGMYSVKGYVFHKEAEPFSPININYPSYESVRLLHNTLQLVAKPAL